MTSLLNLLFPFIREIFFKNDELKKHVRSTSFLFKFIIVSLTTICIFLFIWQNFGRLLADNYESYNRCSVDYRELAEAHRGAIKERNKTSRTLRRLEIDYEEVEDELEDMKIEHRMKIAKINENHEEAIQEKDEKIEELEDRISKLK